MKFDHRFQLKDAAPSYRVYAADGVTARLDFFEHILRVAILRDGPEPIPTWSVCPDGKMPLEGRDKLSVEGFRLAFPAVTEEDGVLRFSLDELRFAVELRNFRISAETELGLLYRDRSGLAYNFEGELGRGSVHYTERFADQRIFGFGDKCGPVNKSGRRYQLAATDSMGFRAAYSDPLYKQIPFYICQHAAGAYGL